MADSKVRLLLFLLAALFCDLCHGLSELDGVVKTIEDREYGVLIDCVDIYKQPALRNPLLKNHTIQMKPTSISVHPRSKEEKLETTPPFNQSWSNYGECPQGTIPVLRKTQHEANRPPPAKTQVIKHYNANGSLENVAFNSEPGNEFVQVSVHDGKYISAHGTLNIWAPNVASGEASTSTIWLINDIDVIMFGWMVDPKSKFGNQVLLTTYWGVDQKDHYRGCYNLECPGFVQVSKEYPLGHPITPVSTYEGTQYGLEYLVLKDQSSNNWWLRIHGVDVGYWPESLFTKLNSFAESITWGGHVRSSVWPGRSTHTTTQMGNGHYPEEGFMRACFFRNLWYATQSKMSIYPEENEKYHKYVTRPECYDIRDGVEEPEKWGVFFYFGGPGYSNTCKSP